MPTSDDLYQAVLGVMAAGVIVQDANGVILECNPSAERILGLSRDQMVGSTPMDSGWWAIREDGTRYSREEHPAMVTLATGEPQTGIIMGVNTPNTSTTWLSVNSRFIPSHGQDKGAAVVTCFRDITEQKLAADRLWADHRALEQRAAETDDRLSQEITSKRRTEAELVRLMNAVSVATEGVAITDASDRYIYANEAAGTIYGCSPNEILGKTWLDMVPSGLADAKGDLGTETMRSKSLGEFHGEIPALRADGTVIPTEVTARAIRDESGQYAGHICIIRDIRARKQAEAARDATHKQAEALRAAMASLTADLPLEQILERTLAYLEGVVPFHCAALLLREDDELTLAAVRGASTPPQSSLENAVAAATDLFDGVMSKGEPEIKAKSEISLEADLAQVCFLEESDSWMGVPLIYRGEAVGLLSLASHLNYTYSSTESDVTKAFADEAAIAIQNARLFNRVQELASTDSLTELYNRRHFFEIARKEFGRARRHGRSLTLVMLDVDEFKKINDQYGHSAGDAVLRETAAVFKTVVRSTDILARYGGDEFVLLLPETEALGARHLAERLRTALAEKPLGDEGIQVTTSLGVASLGLECQHLDELLKQADRALYKAKARGRNQVCVWNER